MSILRKKIIWIPGLIILIILVGLFWSFFLGSLGGSSCQRTDIGTTTSPDGKKEVITFAYNCGPTVGESIHASVINVDEEVDMNANGNTLRIDSNQGQAWPKDENGRPIIKAIWQSPTSLTLYYSMNSEVFYQKEEVNGVKIAIAPLTQ